MTLATETRVYRLGEFHRFESQDSEFLYLVPAGAIFAVDEAVAKLVIDAVLNNLSADGFPLVSCKTGET